MKKLNYVLFSILLPFFVNAQFTFHNPDQSAYQVSELVVENNQVTFLTKGDSVLCTFSGSNWSYYNMNKPFSSTSSNDLAVDNNGNYWMGYYNGLAKYDGATLTEYTTSNAGMKNNYVKSIAFDNNNVGYVSHGSYGISMLSNNNWTHNPNFTGSLLH